MAEYIPNCKATFIEDGGHFWIFEHLPDMLEKLVFLLVNFRELKNIEEPEFIKRLGQDYIVYQKNTPMFFPMLGKIFRSKK